MRKHLEIRWSGLGDLIAKIYKLVILFYCNYLFKIYYILKNKLKYSVNIKKTKIQKVLIMRYVYKTAIKKL